MLKAGKLALLVPAVAGLLFFWASYVPNHVLYPGLNVSYYSDKQNKEGNSVLHSLAATPEKLCYSFTLKPSRNYSYLGISFAPDSGFLDLSAYDYLEVALEAEHSKRIPLHILVQIPQFSKRENPLSYRQMESVLDYRKEQRTYQLPISEFKTPSWWFNVWQLSESEVGKPNYDSVSSLSIQNCQLLKPEIKERVTVYHITAMRNNARTGWLSLVSVLGTYLLFFLISRKKRGNSALLLYKKLEIENAADEEANKILRFIAENYHRPELDSQLLQKELGMTEVKIAALLKSCCRTTFKKQLNQIRLQEARRLLLETDRQVSDIAYLVGYSNISHFNRVFKEAEGTSPNEYRRKADKKSLDPSH